MNEEICNFCKKKFKKKRKNQKLCSQNCRFSSYKKKLYCTNCKNEFTTKRCIKRKAKKILCDFCKSKFVKNTPERKRIYILWRDMKRKCHDKKHKQYYLHGEKGFRFCIDWMKFDSFYMWFKLNRVGLKDTFIIKNEFKIYSPQNCTVLPLTEKRRIYEKKRSKFKLKIGQKFGNLIVVNDLENCRYRCQCDCKNFITSYAYPLISGKIKNCKKCKYGMKYAWSRNYPECIKCHSMKNPYGSKGICRKCYEKEQTQYFWREELLFLLKNRILYLEKLN